MAAVETKQEQIFRRARLIARSPKEIVDALEEGERYKAALLRITAEPMRFHPVAGYLFDVDVRKIAAIALNRPSPDIGRTEIRT